METAAHAYKGMRVLVSGASGYLAANLVQALLPIDCQIVRLSRHPEKLPRLTGIAQLRDCGGDIRTQEGWNQALEGAQVVFHFAAQTSVPVAAADPQADLRSNVLPMLGLLETCRQQSLAPVVLFAGTATQVGLPSLLPVNESQPDQPVTIYDLHKLAAENYLKHYISQGYVRGASLRLANVYGPGPHSSSSDRGVLNAMIRRALAGEPLTVYGAGEFVRDYVFVGDVVRAFLLAGAAPDAVNGRHFVIGSGQGHTLAEAFKLVAQRAAIRTGRQTAVEYTNPVAPISLIEQRHFVADIGEFRRATGWTPEKNLVSGIDSTIEAWQ